MARLLVTLTGDVNCPGIELATLHNESLRLSPPVWLSGKTSRGYTSPRWYNSSNRISNGDLDVTMSGMEHHWIPGKGIDELISERAYQKTWIWCKLHMVPSGLSPVLGWVNTVHIPYCIRVGPKRIQTTTYTWVASEKAVPQTASRSAAFILFYNLNHRHAKSWEF